MVRRVNLSIGKVISKIRQDQGLSQEALADSAYRLLFADEGTLVERLDDVEEEFAGHPIVKEIVEFIRAGGKRSLCVPHPEA